MSKISKKQAIALGAGTVGAGLLWKILSTKFGKKRKEVNVDFDGTICTNKFPAVGEPEPDVKENMERLIRKVDVVVHSCRTAKYWKKYFEDHNPKDHEKIIKDFMEKHGIPYTRIETDFDKPFCFTQIDDRVTKYDGDWTKVVDSVLKELDESEDNRK